MLKVLTACALALAAVPALADEAACGPYKDAANILQEQYGETLQGRGREVTGFVMEVYANPESGTFSVLMVAPEGVACMVAAGDAWDSDPVALPIGNPA